MEFDEVTRDERKGYDYIEYIYYEYYKCGNCEKSSVRKATFTTLTKP